MIRKSSIYIIKSEKSTDHLSLIYTRYSKRNPSKDVNTQMDRSNNQNKVFPTPLKFYRPLTLNNKILR